MPDRPEHQPLSTLFKRAWASVGEIRDELRQELLGDPQERELDAQLRDNGDALVQCRHDLASCKAQRVVAAERVAQRQQAVKDGEAQVAELLARRRKSAAQAQALDVAKAQARLQSEKQMLADIDQQYAQLQALIETGKDNERRLKHMLGLLRTSRNLRQAQAAMATVQPDGQAHPESAVEALKRSKVDSEGVAPVGARMQAPVTPLAELKRMAEGLLNKLEQRQDAADAPVNETAAAPSSTTSTDGKKAATKKATAAKAPATKKTAAKKISVRKAAASKSATKKVATKKATSKRSAKTTSKTVGKTAAKTRKESRS